MISIIMPSLDPEFKKIKATLNSVFLNEGKFEVILVLQKTSSEKTALIQKHFIEEEKLSIITDENIGISKARNKGIKASSGDWILLLDDDVYIKPNSIETLQDNLQSSDLIYYGNAKITDTEEHYVKYFLKDKNVDIWSYNRVCSIALIFNKSVFANIGYFDEDLGAGTYFGSSEESDLILRALLKRITIRYMADYVVYHERAVHPLSKVERYARGGGALYKKFLYCKRPALYIKFTLDFILRILFLLTFKKKRYVFLKGFFDGVIKFKGFL